jgi:hypothetical protein
MIAPVDVKFVSAELGSGVAGGNCVTGGDRSASSLMQPATHRGHRSSAWAGPRTQQGTHEGHWSGRNATAETYGSIPWQDRRSASPPRACMFAMAGVREIRPACDGNRGRGNAVTPNGAVVTVLGASGVAHPGPPHLKRRLRKLRTWPGWRRPRRETDTHRIIYL